MCECGSTRVMRVSGKTSDMASVRIPHLDYDHVGYVPGHLNIGAGDYIRFAVCMDCGRIQNWSRLYDGDILEDEDDD